MEKFNKVAYGNEWKKRNKDRIIVLAPKGTKDAWKAAADSENLSITQYVIKAVRYYQGAYNEGNSGENDSKNSEKILRRGSLHA